MATVRRLHGENLGGQDIDTFVGRRGDVLVDPNNPEKGIRVSDGVTPGGVPASNTDTLDLPSMQSAFDAGTVEQKRAFQSSVSGDPAPYALPRVMADQPAPLIIAHRGGASVSPETTLPAYDACVFNGATLLEVDAKASSDGVLYCFHDITVDYLTNGTGSFASLTSAQVDALSVDLGPTYFGAGWSGDLKIPRFSEWLNRYKGHGVLLVEDKNTISKLTEIRQEIEAAGIPPSQVVLQQWVTALSGLQAAAAAGYPTCCVTTNGADITASALVAAGVKYVACAYATFPQSKYDEMTAAGLAVLPYTLNRRYQREIVMARGAMGLFSDDPVYVKSNTAITTVSSFHTQKMAPGMIGALSETQDSIDPNYRGKFFAPDYFGWDTTAAGYRGCLQGYLCPVANPSNFTFDFRLTFDSVNDASRWASIFIGVNDAPFLDNNEAAAGNHLLIRQNGTLAIYTKPSNTTVTLINQFTGTPFTLGTEYRIRVTTTPTDVTAACVDSSGTVLFSVVAATSTYRGGYITIGRNGCQCKYRKLRVS